MRSRVLFLALGLLLLGARPGRAAEDALFQQLGGLPGIERIVSGSVDRAIADPRIAWSFDNVNHERLKHLITQQFCFLAGGPCPRRDRGMGPAHRHLSLREGHFNALVENLQESMDAAGTPFRAQLRLLALLAPMKREIVAP